MKSNFEKQMPKVISYRNNKHFDNDRFRHDLLMKKGFLNLKCNEFETIFLKSLEAHAPMRKRYIRANNSPFVNKELRKAIMVRSRLLNKFLKSKTEDSKMAYNKQRNWCVSLLRNTKKFFYENLNPNLISDKLFWKQVKPFFSDKSPSCHNITLLHDGKIISDYQ